MKKTLIIAHRGASGYSPENTLAAFEKAVEMGADGIELDVHLSRDKRLVVCHDEKVDRTTNGKGFIKDMTIKELKSLDAGSWFDKKFNKEKILMLEEVLDFTKEKNILINIELKNGIIPYKGLEEKVIYLLKSYHLEEKTIISSFNHYSLLEVKKIDDTIKTGILYMAGLVDPWAYAAKLKADIIHPFFYNIRPLLIKGCSRNHIGVIPFTVNENAEFSIISKMNVTGIITNFPDRARKFVY